MSMNENRSIDLLLAQTQTWNHMFNFISSSAAKCAIELGIPDVLYKHDKPMSLSDLTAELSLIDHSKVSFLPILMRFLVHSGFLNQHEKEHYSLTAASDLLVKDNPLSMRSYFLIIHDPVLLKAWSCLSDWFQDDSSTAFHTAHEKSLWDYYVQEPRVGDSFNESMASDSRLIANVLITECKHVFEGLTSLVDVGGGTGTVAITIAKAFPAIKCTVLDLPRVVGNLKGSGNVEFVGGSMFEKIPNANAILLKWILHNWSDEDCVKILKKCKESIPSREEGGKVIIIDIVLENPNVTNEFVRAQHYMDLLMMVCYAAKQRTKMEWERLFIDAGFNEYKITPTLGTRSLIEIYP
ncbi:PREDICTED: trans-resveratrol di-O-methyltransferase-like [Nicotiana attenuata]|uniref:Myricetin 7/4'-O-methyltransferase 2 n=1 Tax=Nicotiana attenuata TaxID=49451 RepID=A0A1J6JYS5_NICAT|nr:PREDICTED: trans-resveratrol di-O-methyltransferase-like [Nicotiana attenuata]OIT22906.1 trans-resveratrol di-o-methyltransferase [Nicotiana attenuata]